MGNLGLFLLKKNSIPDCDPPDKDEKPSKWEGLKVISFFVLHCAYNSFGSYQMKKLIAIWLTMVCSLKKNPIPF